NTPYTLSRAIQVCNLIQTVTPKNEFKTLLPFYQKILQALQPHLECSVQNNQTSEEPLFGFLYKQTLEIITTDNPTTKRILEEATKIYFQSALSFLKKLIDDPNAAPFQAYYLSWCFYLLNLQAAQGVFEQHFSSYLHILKE